MTGGWRDAWRMGGASGSAFPGSLSAFLERRATWVAAIIALVAALATITSDPIGVFNDDGIYLLGALRRDDVRFLGEVIRLRTSA